MVARAWLGNGKLALPETSDRPMHLHYTLRRLDSHNGYLHAVKVYAFQVPRAAINLKLWTNMSTMHEVFLKCKRIISLYMYVRSSRS